MPHDAHQYFPGPMNLQEGKFWLAAQQGLQTHGQGVGAGGRGPRGLGWCCAGMAPADESDFICPSGQSE